ncbi:hypothetical protein QR685DRAFT_593330 [Neurospora intermedia]|uniref:Uncharacterized protein n=1 Tax=Neurospora intermedia TaxID=5142 RepID=A0ABR3DPI2_NEUIN
MPSLEHEVWNLACPSGFPRRVRAWMGAPGDAPRAPQAPVVWYWRPARNNHGTVQNSSQKNHMRSPQKLAWTPRTPSGAGGHLGDFGDPRISMRDTHLGSPTVEPETPHKVEAGKHEDGGRRNRSGPRQPGSGTRRKRFVLLCALDPLSATIDAVPWLNFVRLGQKSEGWMMAESREPELGSRTLRDDPVLSWPDARVLLRLTAVSSIGRPSRGHAASGRRASGKSSIVRAIMDPFCGVLVPLGPHYDSVCTPVGLSLSETLEENPRSHALSASMLPGIIGFGCDWCTKADAMEASSILKGSLYQTRYMNNSQPPTGKCGSQGLQDTNG